MKRLNQAGSHVVVLAVGILVIAAAGFVGFRVMNSDDTKSPTAQASTATVTAPATIESKADLTKTSQALDSSSSDINSGVNGDSLDSSLDDLL